MTTEEQRILELWHSLVRSTVIRFVSLRWATLVRSFVEVPVANTSVIASFKIISESGVAAGVRRIEALTSTGLLKYYDNIEKELNAAAKAAKAEPENLERRSSLCRRRSGHSSQRMKSLRQSLPMRQPVMWTARSRKSGVKVLAMSYRRLI